MTFMDVLLQIIVPIISGIATAIPLIIQLVKAIKESIKSKNWTSLMQLVLQLMADAEKEFDTGAERKQHVISTIKAMEKTLNYDVDENVIGEMIDAIIAASKIINADK